MKITSISGFTLAEMMVVMLVATIILAAMAPVMSTRIKVQKAAAVEGNSPWQWAEGGRNDIYYSENNNQAVMIGQNTRDNTTDQGRLIINRTQSDNPVSHIIFKEGNTILSRLLIGDSSLILGNAQKMGANTTAIGINALSSVSHTGSNNTAIGTNALKLAAEGSDNTAIGSNTLSSNTTGNYNTAIGSNALNKNTSGYHNIAIGSEALSKNTAGYSNVAIGSDALKNAYDSNTSYNVAIGDGALKDTIDGYDNVAIGYNALSSGRAGADNVAIGTNALSWVRNNNDSHGNNNVAIGFYAMQGIAYKTSSSTAIGAYACNDISGDNKEYITCIGANSKSEIDGSSRNNTIILGTSDDTVYIPGNLVVSGNSALGLNVNAEVRVRNSSDNKYGRLINLNQQAQTYIDNIKEGTVSFNNAFTSDRRLKNVGTEYISGLDKINQLKLYHYTFKKDETKTPHVGVMAQDLQKIFPNAVKKGEDGFLKIRTEDMFYAVINAVKELDRKITSIINNNLNLTRTVKQLQNDNNRIHNDIVLIKNDLSNKNKILEQIQNSNKALESENEQIKLRLDRLEAKINR